MNIPILTEEQSQTFEGPITECELLNALKSMPNNKSPGNDSLTKEFEETFWEEIKIPLCNSLTKLHQNGELKYITKASCNKTYRKEDKDKKLIKNWRPIFLLNVGTKLVSKVLAQRLKKVFPSLIWGHSKKNVCSKLPVFDPSPPLVCSCLFYMYPSPPQRTFTLVSYVFSKKVP